MLTTLSTTRVSTWRVTEVRIFTDWSAVSLWCIPNATMVLEKRQDMLGAAGNATVLGPMVRGEGIEPPTNSV